MTIRIYAEAKMKKLLYLTLFFTQVAYAGTYYQVIDLGQLNATPVAINDDGVAIASEVSVDRQGETTEQPIIWNGVAWRTLVALPGENFHPQAISRNGQAVGERYARSDGSRFGWSWDSKNGFKYASGDRRSSYVDVNDSGDIAITAETASGARRPYVFSKGQVVEVLQGMPKRGKDAVAWRMNNAGDVAGVMYDVDQSFFYVALRESSGYLLRKIPAALGPGGFYSVGGLNSNGIALLNENVCAEDNNCCEQGHGYRVWDSRTGKVLLSRFNKQYGAVGTATGINDRGTVVGAGYDSSGWIWDKDYGPDPIRINDVVAPGTWNILEPAGINNRGEILATAMKGDSNERHIVILRPAQ